MRTWGRVANTNSALTFGGPGYFGGPGVAGGAPPPDPIWQLVETDANGLNDNVYLTALIQVLKLEKPESPFFADWGIGARRAVMMQIFPDYDVQLTQQRFAPYFVSLQISKVAVPTPTYNVVIVTHSGRTIEAQVPY